MRVAIVGGGVGGLTAAIALAHEQIETVVLEQEQEFTPEGSSLQLGPNAVRLLEPMGLLARLRQAGGVPEVVRHVRWDDGSVLHEVSLGEAMVAHFGAPELDFFRPDLHRVLVEAAPVGALRMGAHVTRVEQDADGAAAVLDDGTEIAADLIVSADGVQSTIRQHLFGAEQPVFSGTVVYRGVAPRQAVIARHPPGVSYYWLGPQRHGVSYWLGKGEFLAVTLGVQDAEWSRESWTLKVSPEEAVSYVEDWDEALRARIRACTTMLRGAVFVRRPAAHWSHGRVTLLGDAAHAMQPHQAQGATQAVEDAYVLARCVAQDRADPCAALRRYERIRMRRAQAVQASGAAAAAAFYLPDGEEQRDRDAGYRTLHQTRPWGLRQDVWEYDARDEFRADGKDRDELPV